LEFRINQIDINTTEVEQIAQFLPIGLGGILYWYLLLPFHKFIFSGMLKGIAKM